MRRDWLIPDLYQHDLFIVAMNDAEDVYRYHGLFAEFLRHRLTLEYSDQQRAELHCKAAKAEAGTGRAIVHYLAAQMWEEAALLIETRGESVLKEGLIETVEGWISALP